MKHIAFLLFCMTVSHFIRAQGTLQFSQVKMVTSSETVPSGKVWKVNSFFPLEALRDGNGPRIYTLSINGTARVVGHSAWQYASYAVGGPMACIDLPLWLPAGTLIDPAAAGSYLNGINVTEFTVIP